MMQLDDWIIANGLSRDEVARRLRVPRARLDALINRQFKRLSPALYERIYRLTDGRVTADDLFLGPPEERVRRLLAAALNRQGVRSGGR